MNVYQAKSYKLLRNDIFICFWGYKCVSML